MVCCDPPVKRNLRPRRKCPSNKMRGSPASATPVGSGVQVPLESTDDPCVPGTSSANPLLRAGRTNLFAAGLFFWRHCARTDSLLCLDEYDFPPSKDVDGSWRAGVHLPFSRASRGGRVCFGHLFQLPRLNVVNETPHRNLLRDPGMRFHLLDLLAHVLFKIAEGVEGHG